MSRISGDLLLESSGTMRLSTIRSSLFDWTRWRHLFDLRTRHAKGYLCARRGGRGGGETGGGAGRQRRRGGVSGAGGRGGGVGEGGGLNENLVARTVRHRIGSAQQTDRLPPQLRVIWQRQDVSPIKQQRNRQPPPDSDLEASGVEAGGQVARQRREGGWLSLRVSLHLGDCQPFRPPADTRDGAKTRERAHSHRSWAGMRVYHLALKARRATCPRTLNSHAALRLVGRFPGLVVVVRLRALGAPLAREHVPLDDGLDRIVVLELDHPGDAEFVSFADERILDERIVAGLDLEHTEAERDNHTGFGNNLPRRRRCSAV
ncbi:hypothetical protein T492DRAFT_840197 [Pavlovales sp. CCMP2436]|nr:hypothetical protein T492DRAFT_840197 [Pavlovales sp. CCMP2436]